MELKNKHQVLLYCLVSLLPVAKSFSLKSKTCNSHSLEFIFIIVFTFIPPILQAAKGYLHGALYPPNIPVRYIREEDWPKVIL